MSRRTARRLALVALLPLAAACYRNVPIESPTPRTGTRVAVQLTDRGSLELAPRIGASIDRVEGTVVQASDSVLTLALSSATDRRGIVTSWTGEEVAMRRDYVARLSERKLSKSRSWIVAAGIIALALASAGFSGAFGGEERGGDGTTQ